MGKDVLLFNFANVLVFVGVGLAFVYGVLIAGWFIRPKEPTSDKLRIYECGEPTIGSSWVRYNIRFYTIALVFLVFDVEVVFLFPVAAALRLFVQNGAGVLALVEILTFILILLVGLVYAWRYGNLDWIHSVLPTWAPRPQTKSGD